MASQGRQRGRIDRLGWIFTLSVDYPGPALGLAAVIALVCALILPGMQVDFSLESLYPNDSELARFGQAHRARFGRDDDVIFAIREGDPFHPAIARVEAEIALILGITETASPASFEVVEGRDGVLGTRPMTGGASHPLVTGVLVGTGADAGAVMARVSDTHNQDRSRQAIVERIEQITAQADGTWHLSGVPVVRAWYVRLLKADMSVLLPLAVAVSAVFFVLSFRDWRHVALGVVSVSLGGAAAASGYVATGTPFNVFAPAFVAVVIVVGTSDLVHLVHRFTEHHGRLGDSRAAARSATREVALACTLTSGTTAIGFFALLTTDIPPIRTFGLATGLGVMFTFVVAFLLVPPVLARLGPPAGGAAAHATAGSARMERLGIVVIRHRRAVLAGGFAFSAACVGLSTLIRVDHRILEDVRADEQVSRATRFAEDHMGGVLPLQVEIAFDTLDPREPEALAAVEALAGWLRDQEMVGWVASLPDLSRNAWSALSGEDAQPPTRQAAAQALLVAGMGGTDPVPRFLADDGEHPPRSRIVARVSDRGHRATVALVEAIGVESRRLLEPLGGTATVTGVAWLAQEINTTLTRQFAGSFGIAIVLIGVVWYALTRSLRRTAVALIPNIVPLLGLLAALGAMDLGLKPSTAMVFSIGLGIAVDDTIHFLASYEVARKRGESAEMAARYAYRTAGRSTLDTSVLLVAGFLIFGKARFVATANFGLLTAWTVTVALAADLFLLGPLLVVLDQRAGPSAGLPEDGLPQDGLPQDGLPQDGLPQDGLPQDIEKT